MTVTPVNSISLPVQYAANLLSSSATFRTLTGAANETEAKEFIHLGDTIDFTDDDDPEQIVCPRPRGIVYPEENQDDLRQGPGEWISKGAIAMEIELVVPTTYKINRNEDDAATQRQKKRDANVWLWNKLGAIKDEMMVNSGQCDADGNPYLNVLNFSASNGPGPPRSDSGETWGWIKWVLEWV